MKRFPTTSAFLGEKSTNVGQFRLGGYPAALAIDVYTELPPAPEANLVILSCKQVFCREIYFVT